MITLKSNREIELMAKAGNVVALVHKKMKEVIKPGITTFDLNKIAEEVIFANHATPSFKNYQGFPSAICTSINDTLIHGIPDHTVLKEGDVISVDVGACVDGYHGDSAWTYFVGEVSDDIKKLCEVTEQALMEGLKQARVGNHIGDISWAIENYVKSFGYGIPEDYTGHGIGKSVHEDPYVPNVGKKGSGPLIKKGLCIAIEPMVFMGSEKCYTMEDGWGVKSYDHSVSAHYEHSIAILDNGIRILTKEEI